MNFEYTKNIDEIFRVPNKFPDPKDKETLLKLQDKISEENAFDFIEIEEPINELYTYSMIAKYPVIYNEKPFVGSYPFFCTPGRGEGTIDYPSSPSSSKFVLKNLFNEKAQKHFDETYQLGKSASTFVYVVLNLIYGNNSLIPLLEKKYNIYQDVKDEINVIISTINKFSSTEKLRFEFYKDWLLKFSNESPDSLLGMKISLEELTKFFMMSTRCNSHGYKGIKLEVVHSNEKLYSNMSGIDIVFKKSEGQFVIDKIIYNNKTDCVKSFNELDYFFPLFSRSEIMCEIKFKKEVLKRTLGSFFLSSCYFENENSIKEVEADEFFIAHALNTREFKNIKNFSEIKKGSVFITIKENKCLSDKDKSILNQLFYLVKEETMSIFKSMNLSPKTITPDEFSLLKMQFRNNEPMKLEKMFNSSLRFLNQMEEGSVNIKDIKFDYEEWS